MPTQTVNLTLQEDITRAALQALIAGSDVIPKRKYRITDAIGPTSEIIIVVGETVNTVSGYAINETTNEWGVYDITPDTFTAQGAVGDFIPYDKADQTTDITGGPFDADPASSTGFTMDDGAGTTTSFEFANGNVIIHISSITRDTIFELADGTITGTVSNLADAQKSEINIEAGSANLVHLDGSSNTAQISLIDNAVRVITPFVDGGGDPTGKVLVGQDTFGAIEYGNISSFARVSGSNYTTTSATESVVTGLSLPVLSNSLYKGRITLRIGCDGNGGVRFGFNFPALAALLVGMVGNSTATTAQQMFSGSLISGTAATIAFNTASGQSGFVIIDFTLETGANAGNVELIARSGTAGQTSTVYTNMSNMTLEKIA